MNEALTFKVGAYGEFLSTRNAARTVKESLERRIRSRQSDDAVIIDFADVGAMTISFADEFLGKFYTSVAARDIPAAVVVLRGLNDETQEATSVCLERRNSIAAVEESDGIRLVAAPGYLDELYHHAAQLKTFRANELSELLGVAHTNMNNRLARLVAAGALRRERSNPPSRGGKEFLYSFPCI